MIFHISCGLRRKLPDYIYISEAKVGWAGFICSRGLAGRIKPVHSCAKGYPEDSVDNLLTRK